MEKKLLEKLYLEDKLSVFQISKKYQCSQNRINYWLNKFNIKKRTISDSAYISHNGIIDPFKVKKLNTQFEWFLMGLGIGLYWGEGNKANKTSVKLGNTDSDLILCFIKFLKVVYGINENKLKFGLQIFSDINPGIALDFWTNKLKVKETQFQKPVVSKIRGNGNYKVKSRYGVLTVYFNNVKLRNIIISEIEKLR